MIGDPADDSSLETTGYMIISVDEEDRIEFAVTTDQSGKSYSLWLDLPSAVEALLEAQEPEVELQILEISIRKISRKLVGVG